MDKNQTADMDWVELEEVVADIQRKLEPSAVVTRDDRIVGISGRTRKLDLSIRQTVSGCPILIVVAQELATKCLRLWEVLSG